jgi:drug/metabolite transporter (DMT)-like permease
MLTKEAIEKYFMAEKAESAVFVAIGVVAIIAALWCLFASKTIIFKGAALPLIVVGVLLSVVGFTVYKRSDQDRIRNVYAFTMNPDDLKNKELPRMQKVMQNFVWYRYIEITLALVGILLFIFFNDNPQQAYWKGFGLALALMALIALTADFFAEKRGHVYYNLLKVYTQQ